MGKGFTRAAGATTVAVALCTAPALAQSPARFSVDSAVAVDLLRGQNAAERPNIIVDFTASLRLGGGWLAYLRPWFRQPRGPSWDKEIYQAALQYERPGRVATRVDLGYIVSPIGLGMMDMRPDTNPTIMRHVTYVAPMPVFDPGSPRVGAISSTYPLGGLLTRKPYTRTDADQQVAASLVWARRWW